MKKLFYLTLSVLVLATACDKTPAGVEPINKEEPKPNPQPTPNPNPQDPKQPEEPAKPVEPKVLTKEDIKAEWLKDGVLTLPVEYTEIGAGVLKGRSDFHTLVALNVTKLAPEALAGTAVRTLTLPKLQRVEDKALQACRQIRELSLPELEYIGVNGMQECTALHTLRCPKLKTLAEQALMATIQLRLLQLGSVPPSVGTRAFQYTSIAKTLSVAEGKEADFVAFANANRFASIVNGPALQANFSPIPSGSNTSGTDFVRIGGGGEQLTDFVLDPKYKTIKERGFWDSSFFHGSFASSSVETIEEYGLADCPNILFLDMPNLRSLGVKALDGSTRFEYFNLPKLETIGANAFERCYRFERIALPRLKAIGNEAFASCEKLKELELGDTPPTKGQNIFGSTQGHYTIKPGQITLIVPKGKKAEYEVWRNGLNQIGRVIEKN